MPKRKKVLRAARRAKEMSDDIAKKPIRRRIFRKQENLNAREFSELVEAWKRKRKDMNKED